jgi:hypothetical protein
MVPAVSTDRSTFVLRVSHPRKKVQPHKMFHIRRTRFQHKLNTKLLSADSYEQAASGHMAVGENLTINASSPWENKKKAACPVRPQNKDSNHVLTCCVHNIK